MSNERVSLRVRCHTLSSDLPHTTALLTNHHRSGPTRLHVDLRLVLGVPLLAHGQHLWTDHCAYLLQPYGSPSLWRRPQPSQRLVGAARLRAWLGVVRCLARTCDVARLIGNGVARAVAICLLLDRRTRSNYQCLHTWYTHECWLYCSTELK